MARKTIMSIGFDMPGGDAEHISIASSQSLLDADIIVVQPNIYSYLSSDRFQGKPSLTEANSFKLEEDLSHWRSELKIAFDEGKTIFVYLSELQEVFIHTGEKQFSGTGRNQKVTHIVKPFDNYKMFPFKIETIIPRGGKEIRPARDLGVIATYWSEFADYSAFELYIEDKNLKPLLTTKTGNKVVGAIIKGRKGAFVLLPPLQYDAEEFIEWDEENGEEIWSPKAIAFGKRLVGCLVEIDKALRSSQDVTPPPPWVGSDQFRFKAEGILEKEIEKVTKRIDSLNEKRSKLKHTLEEEGSLRRLLYEKGKELEAAILEALDLLGFKAEGFRDEESEFDAVFISDEGRFLGEAEGKDNSAINIDKLSQLERNLQEDFAKEDVTEYAKGVLFGNAYRLQPLPERQDYFTQKCLQGAERAKVALVRTPDLFSVAKYLKESKDDVYAEACRQIIIKTEGSIVEFPPLPCEVTIDEKEELPT